MSIRNPLVFCFPSAPVTHVPPRLAFYTGSEEPDFGPYAWVALTLPTGEGKCVGMQPPGKPARLGCHGLSPETLWASFSHHCYHWFPFSLLSSAQEARLAGPLSDFSWFRLYAFSSKPSSFINLRSFLILMHQSIIISLDSFWQSAATFSCLAWIPKVIYQCVQVKLKSFLLSCARGCLEKCTCLSCPGKILTWRYLTVFCARGFRNSEHCIFEG